MPADITMCCNGTCPINHLCYRYMSVLPDGQTYNEFQPETHQGQTTCEAFARNSEKGNTNVVENL